MTVAGTLRAAEELDRFTTCPPMPALPVSVTVPEMAAADCAAIWRQDESVTPKEATAKCADGLPLLTTKTV